MCLQRYQTMQHNPHGGKRNADGVRLEEEHVPPPITLGEFEVVCSRANRLGRGGFGSVFRGCNPQSGDEAAVKRIEKNQKTQRFIDRELSYMRDCSHGNIVRFFTSEARGYHVFIVMELCVNGNLGEYIESHTVPDIKCARFFANIATGIQYLQAEKRLCHRDLKPENILVDGNETLKIADLGLAREFFLSSSAISGTGVGTFGWLAPEVLGATDDRSKFSFASDIFSLGLLFLAMLLVLPGRKKMVPFTVRRVPLAQWLQVRGDGVLPEIPLPDDNSMGGRFRSIVVRMLAYAARNRCKIHEVTEAIKDIQDAIGSALSSPEPDAPEEVAQSAAEGVGQLAIQSRPSEDPRVKTLGHVTLPVRGDVHLRFGPSNSFMIWVKDSAEILFFLLGSESVIHESRKPIPENHKYNCLKYISHNGELFFQSQPAIVTVYRPDLSLIRTLQSPGQVLALLPGDRCALVDNRASENVPRRLTVATLTDLNTVNHHLQTPPGEVYSWDDWLMSYGREDGRLVVAARKQCCVDFYGPTGEHLRRVPLPSEPGRPGCSATHVLVPMWSQPRILVLNWSGEHICTLDHTHLGLHSDDHGCAVSPVQDGKFSYWVYSKERTHQLYTYQIE